MATRSTATTRRVYERGPPLCAGVCLHRDHRGGDVLSGQGIAMSPVREMGEAANTFMGSLKEQPLSLALVVMNFALIGFVYFQSTQFNSQRSDNVKLFVQIQGEVQK